MTKNYGKELILDIHRGKKDCIRKFSRHSIERYFFFLCGILNMEREDLHFWDYEGMPEEYEKAPAHLKGISAVQFIKTSSIVIHTLDDLKRIYINIFSCKEFDHKEVEIFTIKWFGGKVVNRKVVKRK